VVDADAQSNSPVLSLVVLAWNNLDLTTRCVESLRGNTDVAFELIIVDNGSTDGSAAYAESAADIPVLNEDNLGFAAGMNSGLGVASGRYIAFINNDTLFPADWARPLLRTFETHPEAGIVLPAVTAAGNPVTVRSEPGERTLALTPFGEFPSGVVYVMPTELIRALGGWNEDYRTASAEDLDLAFTVWAHGLDIVLCENVLVEHVSQATVRYLPDRRELYRDNLSQFLDRWESKPLREPLLAETDPHLLEIKQNQARTAIVWIRRLLAAREETSPPQATSDPGSDSSNSVMRWLRSRS
jgi:GT2 family glycosyltransferase